MDDLARWKAKGMTSGDKFLREIADCLELLFTVNGIKRVEVSEDRIQPSNPTNVALTSEEAKR